MEAETKETVGVPLKINSFKNATDEEAETEDVDAATEDANGVCVPS